MDFARVEGERLERANAPAPFGVFTAFVPAGRAAALDRYRDLGLIGPVAPGPKPEPDRSQPPECRHEAPPGPFESRFYDRDGELLDRVPTLVGKVMPAHCKP